MAFLISYKNLLKNYLNIFLEFHFTYFEVDKKGAVGRHNLEVRDFRQNLSREKTDID